MHDRPPPSVRGRHVLFLNWRDTANPEGGGSELYVETIARGLVSRGARVTIFCAAHGSAPADEVVEGVRFVRRGTKLSVYLHGLLLLLSRSFGHVDAVVDVQNGLPFFSRLATRKPVVVLVHHVHREQWPVVYPGLTGRVGWWIESRVAPWLYRRSQYVAVSRATRDELVSLGVDNGRVAVVHNGTDPAPPTTAWRAPHPQICVVGRLVPHKRVEHAIDVVRALRAELPALRLVVVGSGWWGDELTKHAADAGVTDLVRFEGHLGEQAKNEVYAESWLLALPSLKEGWGLVIGEAGMHGTPTVAYASAGGTRESVAHEDSGLLVDDAAGFVLAVRRLLLDEGARLRLGEGARRMAATFTWEHAQESFTRVVEEALAGHRLDVVDPDRV
jgi:glycosyltransferase involved in cell wall biosynthesis